MISSKRSAKINVKVLVILLVTVAAIGVSLFVARHVRRRLLSRIDLNAGQAAYDEKDWPTAYRHFQGYLNRNPDDLEVLKKYAKARLSIRPLDAGHIGGTIAAYRRIIQLDPQDEIAYEKLAELYTRIGNFQELAYIAQTRLDLIPEERKGRMDLVENDRKAHLWLSEALIRLGKKDQARLMLEPFIATLDELPDKYDEYVQACALMSAIEITNDSREAHDNVLKWLDDAVEYAPDSVEARVRRAQLHRGRSEVPGIEEKAREDMLADARKDLMKADDLGTENPHLRLLLCKEWLAHGDLDRAAAELKAVDNLTQDERDEHFLDVNDWTAARFILASELALRKGDPNEAASLATKLLFGHDEVAAVLTEKRHRAGILDPAIISYVTASNDAEDPNIRLDYAADANSCLDEYLDAMRDAGSTTRDRLTYLRALVARAQDKPYAVIDILQPVLVDGTADPRLWRLLAEAYERTNQPSRAVSALTAYLRLRPQDSQARLQLVAEHAKLRDWNGVLEHAQLAESLNPADTTARLLRVEAAAHIAAGQKELDSARLNQLSDELMELRQEHPELVSIRILQATIARYLEQPEKAEEELKLAIEQCEEPLKAEMQLVRHYYKAERMAEAIGTCKAACENHPEAAEPWLTLADLHVANADPNAAQDCLERGLSAVVREGDKRALMLKLALLEFRQDDVAGGRSRLEELAAKDKQDIRIRSLLLSVREVLEDPVEAQRLVDELRTAEGQSGVRWRFHQAKLWLSSDDWRSRQRDIADALQYCIEADPTWSAPVLLLGSMYYNLNDSQRAEDTYRQALQRDSAATDVASALMALRRKENPLSRAEEMELLAQIERESPEVASAWSLQLALDSGDHSRAIEELQERIVEGSGESNDERAANLRIALAQQVYLQDGDFGRADTYLQEAEAVEPNSMRLIAMKVAILKAEGKGDEARRVLDGYVTRSNVFEAYVLRAAYLAGAGDLEGAEKDYLKLTTFADQGARGYGLLGNFYATYQGLDKAVETFETGVQTHPADSRLERALMKTLFRRDRGPDRQRANEILTRLQEQLPKDLELMKIRVALLLEERTPESLEAARTTLENGVRLEPGDVDVHLMLIQVVMEQKEYQRARDLAIRAVGSNPDNPELLSARGRAELALNNTEMAAQLAQLALGQDPNNIAARDVLVAAAVRLTDSSLDKMAVDLARRTLGQDPNSIRAQNAIVALALKTGDRALLDEVRALLESALERNPTNEQMLLSLARVLVSLELPQMAIQKLEAYCQTVEGSSNVAVTVALANLHRLAGDLDEAEQKIEQAERLAPRSQAVIHARFLWLVTQKRFEELEQISSAYLSAEEQNPTTLVTAASILRTLDSTTLKKEGVKLFEHAVDLLPEGSSTSKGARLGLAIALYRVGNSARAEMIHQELLEQYPDDIEILNDLAWILQEYHDDRYAEALELANRGLKLAPDDLHLIDTRGTILRNLPGRLADAMKDFERLVELSPPDTREQAKALLQLGRTCARLDELDDAKEHLKKALEIDGKIDVFTPEEQSEIAEILQRGE